MSIKQHMLTSPSRTGKSTSPGFQIVDKFLSTLPQVILELQPQWGSEFPLLSKELLSELCLILPTLIIALLFQQSRFGGNSLRIWEIARNLSFPTEEANYFLLGFSKLSVESTEHNFGPVN